MESEGQLPLELDITNGLAELRELSEKLANWRAGVKDGIELSVQDERKRVDEYNALIDSDTEVEERIKKLLSPVIKKYLKRGDFEGAKWFVGRSYMELVTAGKVLLFRWILIEQDSLKKKKKK